MIDDEKELNEFSILEDSEDELISFEDIEDEPIPLSEKQKHLKSIVDNFVKQHRSVKKFKKDDIKKIVTYYLKDLHQSRLPYIIFNPLEEYKLPYLLYVSHNNTELSKLTNPVLTFKYVKVLGKKEWFILNHILALFSVFVYNEFEPRPVLLNSKVILKALELYNYDILNLKYANQTSYKFEYVYFPFKLSKTAKTDYSLASLVIKENYIISLIKIINNFMDKHVLNTNNTILKLPITNEEILKYKSSTNELTIPFSEFINNEFTINEYININTIYIVNKDIYSENKLIKLLKKEPNLQSELRLYISKQDNTLIIKPIYYFKDSKIESYTFRPFIKYYVKLIDKENKKDE